MQINNIVDKWKDINDGTRTLLESVMAPEVRQALADWGQSAPTGVVIGGVAVSYYNRPRMTVDVDVLYTSNQIPDHVEGFKKIREHAFMHTKTHVDVEVLDAAFLNLPPKLVDQIYASSKIIEGVCVASPGGLVALKLVRFSRQDQADIERMIEIEPFNIDDWETTEQMKQNWIKFNE